MRCAFNTNAPYTKEGQRITAEIVGDECVFVDHDRMIDGKFPVFNKHMIDTQGELCRLVLRAYNHGQYSGARYGGLLTDAAVQLMLSEGYDEWINYHNLAPIPKFFQS
jgi:hypothetical protein